MKGVIFMLKKETKYILGTAIVGAVMFTIGYGNAKYYKGRIDMANDIMNTIKSINVAFQIKHFGRSLTSCFRYHVVGKIFKNALVSPLVCFG